MRCALSLTMRLLSVLVGVLLSVHAHLGHNTGERISSTGIGNSSVNVRATPLATATSHPSLNGPFHDHVEMLGRLKVIPPPSPTPTGIVASQMPWLFRPAHPVPCAALLTMPTASVNNSSTGSGLVFSLQPGTASAGRWGQWGGSWNMSGPGTVGPTNSSGKHGPSPTTIFPPISGGLSHVGPAPSALFVALVALVILM